MQNASPMWGDPGVTELLQLAETPIQLPANDGGSVTRTMQRAGLLRRLRFYNTTKVSVSAYTGAPDLSPYGPLGGAIKNITVEANGQIPLVKLSGLGATVYNEVQNRDGSILNRSAMIAALNVADSAALAGYDTIGATGDFYAKYPFEFQFALPFHLRGQVSELGLWLLQNQAIDVGVTVTFNPAYAAAATYDAVYSGGTLTAAADLAGSKLEIERELYNIPADPKSFPNLTWAHQVIEYSNPFTGNYSKFSIPRSGLLLRAIVINLDGSGDPVEYTDVSSMSWIYGANETPVSRAGKWLNIEYANDYGRQPPKGVQIIDFYKNGWDGLKLVKDTEVLANLRLETNFAATASGTQKIILDRLYPVVNAG